MLLPPAHGASTKGATVLHRGTLDVAALYTSTATCTTALRSAYRSSACYRALCALKPGLRCMASAVTRPRLSPPGPPTASHMPDSQSLRSKSWHSRTPHPTSTSVLSDTEGMGNDVGVSAYGDVEGQGPAVGDLEGKTAIKVTTALTNRAL